MATTISTNALPAGATIASRLVRLPASAAGKVFGLAGPGGVFVPLCRLEPPATAAAGTVQAVNGVSPDAAGNVLLPTADVCAISLAKRTQVLGLFSPSQNWAADVLLSSEPVHLQYRSIFCDFLGTGATYELLPDFDTPDAAGNATPTWKRS